MQKIKIKEETGFLLKHVTNVRYEHSTADLPYINVYILNRIINRISPAYDFYQFYYDPKNKINLNIIRLESRIFHFLKNSKYRYSFSYGKIVIKDKYKDENYEIDI